MERGMENGQGESRTTVTKRRKERDRKQRRNRRKKILVLSIYGIVRIMPYMILNHLRHSQRLLP